MRKAKPSSISKLPSTQNPFSHACAMEDPLCRIRNLTGALARIAGTLDGQSGAIVQELTLAIGEPLDKVDEIHGFFFRLHHPDREQFERTGWPSSKPAHRKEG